jgi:stalled ribosome rescue protein Dom34
MKRQVGLWIDHREAVIVFVTDKGEEIKRIISNIEQDLRFSAGSRSMDGWQEASPEDMRDRRSENQLNRYYDDVIASIRDAESILILGPGEAKGELEKRLESKELRGRIVGIETADKMTDRQIAAKARQHFGG